MRGGKTVVLDGELDLLLPESGEFGAVTVVHDGGTVPPYTGEYIVEPMFEAQTLETTGKRMLDDVTVNAIEVARTSNPSGGITVYIGGAI